MECAIFVMSCDAYSDLWHDFFELKKRNWPDCPYPTYLITNIKKCEEDGVETICCGDELNWTGRLLYALKQVKCDYVLLMLEDYYISDKVIDETFDEILSFIKQNKVSYYKLEERANLKAPYYLDSDFIKKVDGNVEYGVSLITSIWKTDFLNAVIGGEDYRACEFEVRRNMEGDISHSPDYLCLVDIRNVLNIAHMVQRGQYIPGAVKTLKEKGYTIDTQKRGKLSIYMVFYLKCYHLLRESPLLFSLTKRIRRTFGGKSVSDKYMEEIKQNKYN